MRIGVFDSGFGGLTVLSSLIKKYPNNEYIYFGDTLNAPYGNKTKEELLNLSSKIVEFFIEKKVDQIIIACGTISSNVYKYLKEKYSIPILDILSPTINYLNKNKIENILVMATSMTIQSGIFNPFKQIACPKIVPLIENGEINSLEMKDVLVEYLTNVDAQTIVLGCTHYPLIKDNIADFFNKQIEFIDMGEILANSIVLEDKEYKLTFCFSNINEFIERFIEKNFENYVIKEIRL